MARSGRTGKEGGIRRRQEAPIKERVEDGQARGGVRPRAGEALQAYVAARREPSGHACEPPASLALLLAGFGDEVSVSDWAAMKLVASPSREGWTVAQASPPNPDRGRV
jgi:hypothetical protein